MEKASETIWLSVVFAFDQGSIVSASIALMNPIDGLAVSHRSNPDDPTDDAIGGSDTFYGGIPVFRGFTSLMEPPLYSPLPDDWSVGVADIVEFDQGDRGSSATRRSTWPARP